MLGSRNSAPASRVLPLSLRPRASGRVDPAAEDEPGLVPARLEDPLGERPVPAGAAEPVPPDAHREGREGALASGPGATAPRIRLELGAERADHRLEAPLDRLVGPGDLGDQGRERAAVLGMLAVPRPEVT